MPPHPVFCNDLFFCNQFDTMMFNMFNIFKTQLIVIWQTASIIFYTTLYEDANLTVLSSTTDKINHISNHFWDRWRHEYVVNLRETQQTSKVNIKRGKDTQKFLENCH